MTSSGATVNLAGESDEVVREYADEHECSVSQAGRDLVMKGWHAREVEDDVVADGGVAGGYDHVDVALDRVGLLAGGAALIALGLMMISSAFAPLEAVVYGFGFMAGGAGAWRALREYDRGESDE